MTIRIALHHRTEYHFDRLVNLSPHSIRLRPAPHTRTPIHEYSLKVEPEEHFINWVQDPFGNFIGRFVFPEKTKKFVVDVNLVADLVTINPFDFFVEEYAEYFPFKYEEQLKKELAPYFEIKENSERLKTLLSELNNSKLGVAATSANEAGFDDNKNADSAQEKKDKAHIVHFLVDLNMHIQQLIGYNIRMEPGVQSCEDTLTKKTGSCRDTGWLLVQVLRHMGLAARFVSGYLVQLTSDQKSLDGPSGPEKDFTDLHAWAEVFIPGAGWIGLDPTSGLFAGEGHIPLACTPDPISAAAITGASDKCEVTFKYTNEVYRIHEDPRVTKPYTEKQWQDIQKLGRLTDKKLEQADVRLTMGGEPTFVSIDDMESAQWNIAALGDHKLDRAYTLLLRLRDVFSNKGVLHYGQGKWYPGEQLPRWSLTCAWLKDETAIWNNEKLLDAPNAKSTYTDKHAEKLITHISEHLKLDKKHINSAYEDAPYYLWKEGSLPENVDVLDNKIKDEMERKRIRRVFDNGLNKVAGYCIPVEWNEDKHKWKSCQWSMRREQLYLIPGDSAMGYRLPLDSLKWEPEKKRQKLIDKDPFDDFEQLPQMTNRLHIIRNENLEPWTEAKEILPQPDSIVADEGHLIRTALCVEQRDGHLYIFLPPLTKLEYYLDLLNAIETSAQELGVSIIMEGYEPPHDPRLQRMQVTPDPGVIEVNIHPSANWDELERNTTILYEEARLSRLGTEKFMIDGRHSGTGGGNHITIGAAKPADSPILRRPHLLKSLLTYWQNHPSLSYMFSGLFMGPTSQSPRVDEARDDALYELGIALSEMTHDESHSPWLVDRLLRNLLVDLTGNTHRAEFCIDKLYSPNGSTGRLGLVEFRGFEMPPHAQMSLVQALLLRSLITRFWDKPYEQKLVNWGTELHDRFMLPHFVEKDMQDVIADLQRDGFNFDQSWMNPFVEFRFPRYGVINIDGIELELRFAIEPWHVLGEEVSAQGTSRYVDSSVERLQVKVNGMTDSRHYITCNGRRVPLRNTGTRGEFVGGVRYKAWHPPSALHPTIVAQAPLVFDIVDGWNKTSLGGCTYHVSHPGGRSESTFPVNANEAESRRLARFQTIGHTGGIMEVPIESINPDFPLTLDLRRRTIKGERV